MSKNPLPPTFSRPEKTGGKRNQHLAQSIMEFPDYYYSISERSLRGKIETGKNSLQEAYYLAFEAEQVADHNLSLESLDDHANKIFQEKYNAYYAVIQSGQPGSKCEEDIKSNFSHLLVEEFQNIFPIALIWIICADLLEKENFREQSWACLVEFSFLEYRLELACMKEQTRRDQVLRKKRGGMAYSYQNNLKEYLIELLKTKAPNDGWRTVEKAAADLAPLIWYRHEHSKHRSIYKKTVAEIETLITSWMNRDAKVRKVFHDNKRL